MSHAFSNYKEIPLSSEDVFDESFLLTPFRTKKDLIKNLEEAKKEIYRTDEPVTEEEVVVMIHGFMSAYRQKEYVFPTYEAQTLFEETRAAILQTLLECLVYGVHFAPKSSPKDQFRIGIEYLMQNISATQAEPSAYLRERAGFSFLYPFISSLDEEPQTMIQEKIRPLFRQLHDLNIEEFVRKYEGTHFMYGFNQAIHLTRQELESRKPISFGNQPRDNERK